MNYLVCLEITREITEITGDYLLLEIIGPDVRGASEPATRSATLCV